MFSINALNPKYAKMMRNPVPGNMTEAAAPA
jgi:hypothetical protein